MSKLNKKTTKTFLSFERFIIKEEGSDGSIFYYELEENTRLLLTKKQYESIVNILENSKTLTESLNS